MRILTITAILALAGSAFADETVIRLLPGSVPPPVLETIPQYDSQAFCRERSMRRWGEVSDRSVASCLRRERGSLDTIVDHWRMLEPHIRPCANAIEAAVARENAPSGSYAVLVECALDQV